MATSTSMARSLTSSTAAVATTTKTPISIISIKKKKNHRNCTTITTNANLLPLPSSRLVLAGACHEQCSSSAIADHNSSLKSSPIAFRRSVTLGLTGAILGLSLDAAEDRSSIAAARRPPPPPPTEKKDPNVSGVLAKVLASKKRKEAMKDAMAKLREKGKSIPTEISS